MKIQRRSFVALLGGGAVGLAGCLGRGDPGGPASVSGDRLRLATTTSTYVTGLLDELNGPFENRYGVFVETVPQGTGAALETGRRGDADVVLVHAREREDEFVAAGYGVNRRDVMANDFVVVGPSEDPAGIAGDDDAPAAVAAIADSGSTFVSRGDESGTNAKERELWEEAGIDPAGEWYRDVGGGMGEALTMADQQAGYTLADRGTLLWMRDEVDLVVHVQGPLEGGPDLLANPYGIVVVNPAIHENVAYDLAMAYVGFVTSVEGQAIIEGYTVEGEQLFFPEALAEEPNFGQYVPEEWTDTNDEA